ncbi:MAG: protein kinase [Burkholderiaceae bacterium]|nr:protein kinase [Burkholderiaceae bacterium]
MSSPTPDDDRTVIRPISANAPEAHPEAPAPGAGADGGFAATEFAKTKIAPTEFASTQVAGRAAPGPGAASAHSSAGDSGNALPVGTYLGEFELTSVLGEGGFGIVYLAWDHSLERRVALKEYMPAALAARTGDTQVQVKSQRHRDTFEAGRKSFVNEAKLLASFDHPSLVKVYRFWEANGTAYMVMPFYEGITLKDKLRELGAPPDEAWLMTLLAPLTEALAVIHAESCFHRDIAPDNVILLNSTGKPLLLDFGAARRVIGDMTQALTVILKPGYAPVEQYAEAPNMKQGAWTDVYALAASVHFAILGRTPPTSVGRLMSDSYVPLEEAAEGRYSARFLRAMDKALRVRPEERTQTIAALRADLGLGEVAIDPQTSLGHNTRPAGIPPPPPPVPKAARTQMPSMDTTQYVGAAGGAAKGGGGKGLWIGLGMLALAAAGAGTYFALAPRKPATPPVVTQTAPAPVVAAPAVAPPAAPARFDIRDEFAKVMSAKTPGFGVEAAATKPQLRIGKDSLGFTVKSARDGFVQVLVVGPDGAAALLFPNAQASDNRIKAGETLLLPKASWKLDTIEPAGAEHFLIIVSAQPRDYSELSKERDYIFLKLPTQEQGQALAASWTRSTPLLLGGLKSCATPDCDAYGAARFSVDIVP